MASKQALVTILDYTKAQMLHIQAVGLRRHMQLTDSGWCPITVAYMAWFQVEKSQVIILQMAKNTCGVD